MVSGRTIDRGELLAIFIGGAGGALARTGAVIAFGDPAHAWPWSIFVINLTGAFALGYVAARPPCGCAPASTPRRCSAPASAARSPRSRR